MIIRGLDLTRRAVLTIRYMIPPGANVFDESITIAPKLSSAKPATLRWRGRIVPEFEFQPASLLFNLTTGESKQSRLLTYRFAREEFKAIQPRKLSEHVNLEEITASEGVRRYRVTYSPTAGSSENVSDLNFVIGEDDRLVTVPITIIGPRPGGANPK